MRKILIVEDEPLLRESYRMILSTEPYDVDVAANGREALEKCHQVHYDLILLDLMMPVMDGPTFMEEYAGDVEQQTGTNIIILSNLSSGDELNRTLELGARRNILKASLSPKQLIAAVRYEVDA